MKKLVITVLSIICICSIGVFSASASEYTRHRDMTVSFDVYELNSAMENEYWTPNLFQPICARTTLSCSNDRTGNAYVYLRGQGYSVGNEYSSTTKSGGYITTPKCYASGSVALYTYHSCGRSDGVNGGFTYSAGM